ncbi:UNVERIFIED_CONTAM: hypothetical protein Sindi_0251800 [Sesamum indicum]
MEGSSRRNAGEEDTPRKGGTIIQITKEELHRMIEEASRNAIVEYERRTATPVAKETARRQLFENTEPQRESRVHGEPERRTKKLVSSDAGSSSHARSKRREPVISRAEVENVGRQIEKLKQQLDDLKKRGDLKKRADLKKRGDLTRRNMNSPFTNEILSEVIGSNFRLPDLPKYDGSKDPREHITAFEMVMNLYRQTDSINAKLFVTTLTGKAQEWFTSLPSGTIESYEQLIHRFAYHFASKGKSKRSATHLFAIRQGSDESLKNFMGRFNNETLEVQDLRIEMMTSILIHGLKKGPFASALARDPPGDIEQLMLLAHKYINEEEMNAIKDREWKGHRDRISPSRS